MIYYSSAPSRRGAKAQPRREEKRILKGRKERWPFMRSIDEISQTNPEKPLLLKVDGKEYYRCPIHIRTRYLRVPLPVDRNLRLPYFEEGDCVYISEKIVSLCQRDIVPKESVKISRLAKFLSKFASHQRLCRHRRPQRVQNAGGHHAVRQAQGGLRRPGRRRGAAHGQAGRVLRDHRAPGGRPGRLLLHLF